MTSEVSAPEASTTIAIKNIGPSLVLASAFGSTLGIVIAQFVDNLGDGILAEILGGTAVIFNNRVEFTGASDLAWAGGFLLCLIVGFIALFAYPTARGHGTARLTLLWVILHLLRQAFVQAVVLYFDSESQLALAYDTLESAPAGLEVVIAAGGGIGLLLIALSAASAFLVFTPHRSLISTGRKRFNLALWIVVIPAAASMFLAYPFFISGESAGVITALPLTVIMFLATLAAAPGTTTVRGPDDWQETEWPWGLAGTLVVILLFNLLVLRGGVSVNPLNWG